MTNKLITIEGNIGVGKSTLANKLANDLETHLILEEFEDNEFLKKYFQEEEANALAMELYFLLGRVEQMKFYKENYKESRQDTITDFLFCKSVIFAKENLDKAEFLLFKKLYKQMYPQLARPDLVVYLQADVERLMANIQKRGRDFEVHLKQHYLNRIDDGYFAFFESEPALPVLIIDITEIDFVSNEEQYEQIKAGIFQDYEPGLNYLSIP